MFWVALGDVVPLAMAIGLSPFAIVTVVVLLLADGGRPKAALFTLGWMLTVTAITLVAVLVVDGAEDSDPVATENSIDVLQIVVGVAFWGLAWKSWRARPEPGEVSREAKMLDKMGRISRVGALGFGLLQGVVVIKNIPLALAAGARLGEADLGGGQAAIAVIIFGVLASAGMIVLVVAAAVAGQRLDEPIASLKQWLEDNMATIGIVVMLLIGAVLVGSGLAVLA